MAGDVSVLRYGVRAAFGFHEEIGEPPLAPLWTPNVELTEAPDQVALDGPPARFRNMKKVELAGMCSKPGALR